MRTSVTALRSILPVAATAILLLSQFVNAVEWPPANAEARAYLYNLDGEQSAPVLKEGKLSASVWNSTGVPLNRQLLKALRKATVEYHSNATHVPARCYRPRHAIVFYSKTGKEVGFIEVCFDCQRYRASSEAVRAIDFDALKKIFKDLKLPVYEDAGAYLKLKEQTPSISNSERKK